MTTVTVTATTTLLSSTKLNESKVCNNNNNNNNSNNNKNDTFSLNDKNQITTAAAITTTTTATTTTTTTTTIIMPRITASITQNIKSPKTVADKRVTNGKDNDNCDGIDNPVITATTTISTMAAAVAAITTTPTTTTTVTTITNIANDNVINFINNPALKKSMDNLITAATTTAVSIATANTTTTTLMTIGAATATATATAVATRTMQTDEDFNIRFVNLVRIHKCLYDKKVPEYRNRDNQEKAWLQISQETKESVIHCKERWRNLRACLSRYIKQQSSTDPQHKPYYLTEHMAFLLPFLKSTRNSLDGNGNLAALFQYSQQQQELQQQQQSQCNGINNNISINLDTSTALDILSSEVKHSISENEDEETMDAFDPAVTANIQTTHNHHHQYYQPNNYNRSICSPTLSDTASANSLQPFIPDVQLSELQTSDNVQQQHMATYTNDNIIHNSIQHNSHLRNDSYDHQHHHHQRHHTPEPKRIKTECHTNEATTAGTSNASHRQHLYSGEQADMEFFRSILPDIAGLTPQQKRKLKIGILELIDDVVERYPIDGCNAHMSTTAIGTSNCNITSLSNNNGSLVNLSNGNVTVSSTSSASTSTAMLATTSSPTATTISATASMPISSQYLTRSRNSMREYHHNNHHQYQYRNHHNNNQQNHQQRK